MRIRDDPYRHFKHKEIFFLDGNDGEMMSTRALGLNITSLMVTSSTILGLS